MIRLTFYLNISTWSLWSSGRSSDSHAERCRFEFYSLSTFFCQSCFIFANFFTLGMSESVWGSNSGHSDYSTAPYGTHETSLFRKGVKSCLSPIKDDWRTLAQVGQKHLYLEIPYAKMGYQKFKNNFLRSPSFKLKNIDNHGLIMSIQSSPNHFHTRKSQSPFLPVFDLCALLQSCSQ